MIIVPIFTILSDETIKPLNVDRGEYSSNLMIYNVKKRP